WNGSGYLALAVAVRGPARIGSSLIGPTPLAATALTYAGAGSKPPSRARPTRTPTAAPKAPAAGGHQGSTPRSTNGATPSSAASTGSNATVPWPPGTTSLPSATKPPSTSPPSTNGYGHFETRPSRAPRPRSRTRLARRRRGSASWSPVDGRSGGTVCAGRRDESSAASDGPRRYRRV